MQNVVHQYFKKVFDDFTILVQVNPVSFRGMELIVQKNVGTKKRKLKFDKDIFKDLKVDGFNESSSLEFNLYLKGLVKIK